MGVERGVVLGKRMEVNIIGGEDEFEVVVVVGELNIAKVYRKM